MFETCPCGSGKTYMTCCGRLHAGAPAATAEELMRSRYTAFSKGNEAYLLKSWASDTRPRVVGLDPEQLWTGLEVLDHLITGPNTATVRFKASWRKGRRTGHVSEVSRFRRDGAGWVYIDGVQG